MAKAKTALLFLLALLILLIAVSAQHDDAGADPGAFFARIPWFGGGGGGPQPGGFFGGGGWGEGGPGGYYRRGAVVAPSTVCAEHGPCHGKRLTCPARCFKSFSYAGKHGGGGGGGGGCTFDCTNRCVASC